MLGRVFTQCAPAPDGPSSLPIKVLAFSAYLGAQAELQHRQSTSTFNLDLNLNLDLQTHHNTALSLTFRLSVRQLKPFACAKVHLRVPARPSRPWSAISPPLQPASLVSRYNSQRTFHLAQSRTRGLAYSSFVCASRVNQMPNTAAAGMHWARGDSLSTSLPLPCRRPFRTLFRMLISYLRRPGGKDHRRDPHKLS